MTRPTRKPVSTLGVIAPGCVMALAVFRRLSGLGHKSIAAAQRAGLRTVLFGRQKYVLSDDAIGFFTRLANQQATTGQEVQGER